MKKMMMMVVVTLLIMIIVSGCGNNEEANVAITTSSGFAGNYQAYVGNIGHSGSYYARVYETKVSLKSGETATIKFSCPICGDKQEYTVNEPWAKLISCKCKEETKSFVAIAVQYDDSKNDKTKTDSKK